MDPQHIQAITNEIEKLLLQEIITSLKNNKIDEEEASQLARDFISLLPLHDQQDLLAKLYDLSQKHMEVRGLYLHYAIPAEEEARQRKLTLMRASIKNGDIEHALSIAKGGHTNG